MSLRRRVLPGAAFVVAALCAAVPGATLEQVARAGVTVARTAEAVWTDTLPDETRRYRVTARIDDGSLSDLDAIGPRGTGSLELEVTRCVRAVCESWRTAAPAGFGDESPLLIDPTLEYGVWDGELASPAGGCRLRVEWGIKTGTSRVDQNTIYEYMPPHASFGAGAKSGNVHMYRRATARASGTCVPAGLVPDRAALLTQRVTIAYAFGGESGGR